MTQAEKAKALVHRFEMESMALHHIQREWLEREITKLLAEQREFQRHKRLWKHEVLVARDSMQADAMVRYMTDGLPRP